MTVPAVDEEHAVCRAARAGALAALARNDAAALALALSQYRCIAEAHFRSEEDFMRACAFPQAVAHGKAHAQYLDFLACCSEELERGGLTATVRAWIGEGLPLWVDVHFENDCAIVRHVERAGTAAVAGAPWRAGLPDALRALPAVEPTAPTAGPSSPGRLAAGLRELFPGEGDFMPERAHVGAPHHALAHELMRADLALLGRAIDEGAPGAAARWAKVRTAMWLETHRAHADAALDAHVALPK
jgi:hemerythrin